MCLDDFTITLITRKWLTQKFAYNLLNKFCIVNSPKFPSIKYMAGVCHGSFQCRKLFMLNCCKLCMYYVLSLNMSQTVMLTDRAVTDGHRPSLTAHLMEFPMVMSILKCTNLCCMNLKESLPIVT